MIPTKFNKNISFNTLILNFKHCWIKYVVISDCLWNNSEEVRFPQHFKEELHNSQVCRQDHECVVRLHHLSLPRGRHRQSQTRVAHRICILDPHPLYIYKVIMFQDNLKFDCLCYVCERTIIEIEKNCTFERLSVKKTVQFKVFQLFKLFDHFLLSGLLESTCWVQSLTEGGSRKFRFR